MKRWKALALAGVGLVGAAALISSSAVLAARQRTTRRHSRLVEQRQPGAGEGPVGAGGQGVRGVPPGRDDPGCPAPERAVHDEDPDRPAVERPTGRVPELGRWRARRPGEGRQGRRRDEVRLVVDQEHRRRRRRMAGRRQAVRDPVQPRRRRVLVQQGSLREGGDHVSAEDVAPVHRRRQEAEDGGHHAHRDRKQGSLAGRLLLGLLRDEALQQGDDAAFGGHVQLQGSMLAQGRSVHAAADRHASRSRTASSPRPLSRARRARPGWSATARRQWSCRGTGTPA